MIRLLVPIDFSDSSKKALEYAVHIQKKANAEITALHVASTPPKKGTKLVQKMQEVAKEEDRKIINDKMAKFLEGEQISDDGVKHPLIRYGDPAKQIVNVSIQEEFDFVVMGTKGGSRIAENFLGNNTYRALKLAMIPMIVVPFSYKVEENPSATIALKFEKLNGYQCSSLIDRTQILGYQPQLLTVVDDNNVDIEMSLNYKKQDYDLSIVRSTKPIEVISEHIKKDNPGLLALHFNIYSFFKALTTPLVSKEFTFRSPIPILFIK